MRTLPGNNSRPQQVAQQPQQATNVQPLRQHAPAPAQQRQQAPAAASFRGGGLPPPPADFDPNVGGGSYEKRDDQYWKDNPLRQGEYYLLVYVNKIKWWNLDGYTVVFRATDWDSSANRPGEHHGRPIEWAQGFTASKLWDWQNGDTKAGKAYGHFRHKLISAYKACGWPEERWEIDDTIPQSEWQVDPKTGQPAPPRPPPWHLFFVHQLANGLAVPVVLRAKVVVERGRERWPEVRSLEVVKDSVRKVPFEAPMPYEVPPAVAEFHHWVVNETKTYTVKARDAPNGFHYEAFEVETAVLNRVDAGGLGLPTYKDL